jgi:hypothetical protein
MKILFRQGLIFLAAALFFATNLAAMGSQVHALDTEIGDGVLTYGRSGDVIPKWRTYGMLSDSFGSAQDAVTGSTPRNMTTKTSPIKQEAISAYSGSDSILHVMCYNGTSWSEDWTVNVGGAGAQSRFDVAYEKTTGDALIVYSRNATTNEMVYRTKAGTNGCGAATWSSATNIDPIRTTGTVVNIRLEASIVSTSNVIGAAWSDSNNILSAMEWTGTAWNGAEPATPLTTDLEHTTTAGDMLSFDLAMDSTGGNMMIAWGQYNTGTVACTVGVNCIMYARYTTTWQTDPAIPANVFIPVPLAADEASSIDLSAHPTSNEIVLGALGNFQADLTTAYWSGTAWSTFANRDTSASGATGGTKFVATGWLRSTTNNTTRSVIVYADQADATTTPPGASTDISWSTYSGATNTKQQDWVPTPTPGGFRWFDIQTNPLQTDELMLTFSDSNANLYAKHLTMDGSGVFAWTNADGGASLEATLAQTTNSPFGFAFWRYIPGILGVDIVDGANHPVGSPSFGMDTVVVGNTCQTASGVMGITGQRIRLTNTTASPAWTLSVAPTGGTTASWTSGMGNYDYNDPAGSPAGCSSGADADGLAGQLSIDPSAGTITPKTGCTNTGVGLGTSSAFSQGTVDNITLMTASASAGMGCYWDLLGANLSQTIPAYQASGTYSLNMTMTVVAN